MSVLLIQVRQVHVRFAFARQEVDIYFATPQGIELKINQGVIWKLNRVYLW